MNYDIFNGDADGICALIQLRLAEPRTSTLITGIKRDIQLLKKIDAGSGDKLVVLDVSLDKNHESLQQFLNAGAEIFYIDHHRADKNVEHANLTTLIDTSSNTCTSLIVNDYLQGQYPLWAITAAFGDNLEDSANALALSCDLSTHQTEQLKKLGIYINYNGYGSCIADLHFPPDELYQKMVQYASPFDFIIDDKHIFNKLEQGYQQDMAKALAVEPEYSNDDIAVYILNDEVWARRVNGVLGNALANQYPDRAHAVLTYTPAGDYQVSVRAPLNNKLHADTLCCGFPTGGGRKAAAGINHLPQQQLDFFMTAFKGTYS